MSIILVWQNWLECIKLLVATSLKQRGAWKLSASITCLADKICKSNSCHLSLQNCGHWLEMRGMANVALLHFFSVFLFVQQAQQQLLTGSVLPERSAVSLWVKIQQKINVICAHTRSHLTVWNMPACGSTPASDNVQYKIYFATC